MSRESNALAINGGSPVRTLGIPQWPMSSELIEDEVLAVLRSGNWFQGRGIKIREFEEWLASHNRIKGAAAVANGTQAIELVLRALRIGEGDEVLVPALTFISTASAVHSLGAVAVPVEVDAQTLCIDAGDAASRTTKKTKAVIPVHLAGQMADMGAISKFANNHDLFVIEDAAQVVSAKWKESSPGHLSTAATFSFQSAKLLPSGEGGAIVSRDEELLQQIRVLSNCGRTWAPNYDHTLLGTNSRMTEFQAAILLAQVGELEVRSVRRAEAANSLIKQLKERDSKWSLQSTSGDARNRDWYMAILTLVGVPSSSNGAFLSRALTAEGIPATELYPPFYRTRAFASLSATIEPCTVAEEVSRTSVWLHHSLISLEIIPDIVEALLKVEQNVF